MKHKISVIVPIFNEEKTIAQVLAPLAKVKNIAEIICINDGSTDMTARVLQQFPTMTVYTFSRNLGKASALSFGITHATGDIIVFLDADIKGISTRVIEKLTNPLLKKTHDVAIGYPSWRALDKPFIPVMGQRAYFKKDLLPLVKKMEGKGYGIELFLNYMFCKKRIAVVGLPIEHVLKFDKQPFETVVKMSLKEARDIVKEILKQENPTQYLKQAYLDNFFLNRLPS